MHQAEKILKFSRQFGKPRPAKVHRLPLAPEVQALIAEAPLLWRIDPGLVQTFLYVSHRVLEQRYPVASPTIAAIGRHLATLDRRRKP